ncbi:MAG: hypothetical protein AAFU79_08375 [Myxococcota bacterium]
MPPPRVLLFFGAVLLTAACDRSPSGSSDATSEFAADAADDVEPGDLEPGDSGSAEGCTCIDLSPIITSGNMSLCGCPPIQYGCRASPQTFQGPCDIAPRCHFIRTDPMTGCDMPAVTSNLTGCSCLVPNTDAG